MHGPLSKYAWNAIGRVRFDRARSLSYTNSNGNLLKFNKLVFCKSQSLDSFFKTIAE